MKITILCECNNNLGTFTLLRNGSVIISACPKCRAQQPPQEPYRVSRDEEIRIDRADGKRVRRDGGL